MVLWDNAKLQNKRVLVLYLNDLDGSDEIIWVEVKWFGWKTFWSNVYILINMEKLVLIMFNHKAVREYLSREL